MKTILLMLLFLFASFAAHAQGCGPNNPLCIVPTAPLGTNNNQAASTAFVQNDFASPPAIGNTTPNSGAFTTLSASGNLTTNVTGSTQCLQANSSGVVSGSGLACPTNTTGSGFYFHKNGTAQTGTSTGAYTRVTWSTSKFNTTGNALSGNTWTAPTSGLIHFDAGIFWTLHVATSGNPNFDVKIIKNSAGTCNGSDAFAAIGAPVLGWTAPNSVAWGQASGDDQATAGDVYEVCAFGTSDDAMNDLQIDGNQAHVHWSGHYIR